MKTLLTILCVIAVASVAWAGKPIQSADNPIDRVECSIDYVAFNWSFLESDWGFTTSPCDDGGVPAWEYGYWPAGDVYCWGTGLENDYPSDAGESLISPSWVVTDYAYLVEMAHGYNTEDGYDGGNLSVNGVVVEPIGGYPDDEISDSTSYYAWCVDGEPGFTGYSGPVYILDCFDLSAFMGEEVQLSFDFGSDSSVQDEGWAIFRASVGGDVVANDGATWSAVKGLYR